MSLGDDHDGSKFKVGDHVTWNFEAGPVSGDSETPHRERELQRHASREDAQYEIMSDKTDHVALHNTSALKKLLRR
jgi:Hypervirulence associated proteins TUDOR domain